MSRMSEIRKRAHQERTEDLHTAQTAADVFSKVIALMLGDNDSVNFTMAELKAADDIVTESEYDPKLGQLVLTFKRVSLE